MPSTVIYTRLTREELRGIPALITAILAGRVPDAAGLAHGFKMRLAVAFLEKVKLAFIQKARGGTDEAGIKWKPLTKAYLAYGRRIGSAEKAKLRRMAGLGPANRFSPGGTGGLLTKAQENRWWQVYRQALAAYAAQMELREAKGAAASIAWNVIKREGAKTKLEVFGNRTVEIGRDTGILFNSLSPGTLTARGADADYQPPENQTIEERPGELIVGSSVAYAAGFHKLRPIWPDGDQIPFPQTWLDYFARQAIKGLVEAVQRLAA